MVPEQSSPQVREAIEELQLYLSDILPPLVVADSFKLLLKYPASLIGSNIQSWLASRYRAASEIRVSDYLFYAFKKVFLIGQFRLVPMDPFAEFLEELKGLVLRYCPSEEREILQRNIENLGEGETVSFHSVDALIRQRSGELGAPGGPPLTPEDLRGLRRFSLLLDRIARRMPTGIPGEGFSPDPVAHALATAAAISPSAEDFERNLERLRDLGLDFQTTDVFRTLAASLPGWHPPRPPAPETAVAGGKTGAAEQPARHSPTLEAMRRLVAQPEDPGEVARRLNEMVRAACERFNEGALPQAVAMLDLADRIVKDKRVDPRIVDAIRRKGDEVLDVEHLRRYAEAPKSHALLRRALNFFASTNPKGLLADLLREMKRERRKLILQLLEVHGAPARQEALNRLQLAFGQGEGDERWYFRRNLLYLLRRIPSSQEGAPSNEDVDTALRHAALTFPAPLVKEAVANLGQLKHEKAEAALIRLLDDLEKMLIKPAQSAYDPREVRLLLDRVVAALARFGTEKAHRAVVDHGLKKRPELGDTTARLSELAGQDLSEDAEAVDRLLAALKANAPHRLFGFVLHQNDSRARHLIEALSATPSPRVRAAIEGVARRFPDLELGRVASKAIAVLNGSAQAPDAGFELRSAEMDPFGLPDLLQNLAESGMTGLLTLKDLKGEITAEITLKDGKLKSCESRGLTGEQAVYRLLERPAAGTTVFERKPPGGSDGAEAETLLEIPPLCFEGMRRYDEFQQAAALVPDDATMKATEVRPDPHPNENDGIFVNGLWNLVSAGALASDCEGALKADPYRIRRQLAHWVETGALVVV